MSSGAPSSTPQPQVRSRTSSRTSSSSSPRSSRSLFGVGWCFSRRISATSCVVTPPSSENRIAITRTESCLGFGNRSPRVSPMHSTHITPRFNVPFSPSSVVFAPPWDRNSTESLFGVESTPAPVSGGVSCENPRRRLRRRALRVIDAGDLDFDFEILWWTFFSA